MRWILLVLFSIACLTRTVAYGQNPPSEREVFEQLEKHGISLRPSIGDTTIAYVHLSDSETLKALGLLRHVKELTGIHLSVVEPKHMARCLIIIRELRNIRVLSLNADRLTVNDLKEIAGYMQLEEMSLEFTDNTDEDIRELHALKGLKNLKRMSLLYSQAAPKTLKELKEALPQVKEVTLEKNNSIQLLKISPKDDPITKLQKEKFNAAASGLNAILDQMRAARTAGGSHLPTLHFLECIQRSKDAALDLSDQEGKLKIINGYVETLERVYKEAEAQYKARPDRTLGFFRVRYYYLDAQILQLRLKKQLEAK